jgi:hypothetical protein
MSRDSALANDNDMALTERLKIEAYFNFPGITG